MEGAVDTNIAGLRATDIPPSCKKNRWPQGHLEHLNFGPPHHGEGRDTPSPVRPACLRTPKPLTRLLQTPRRLPIRGDYYRPSSFIDKSRSTAVVPPLGPARGWIAPHHARCTSWLRWRAGCWLSGPAAGPPAGSTEAQVGHGRGGRQPRGAQAPHQRPASPG